jgi:hypothetical protein
MSTSARVPQGKRPFPSVDAKAAIRDIPSRHHVQGMSQFFRIAHETVGDAAKHFQSGLFVNNAFNQRKPMAMQMHGPLGRW